MFVSMYVRRGRIGEGGQGSIPVDSTSRANTVEYNR
jgi:hypothetical protein